jgi:coenzyme Q-binding protein COQ10
MESFRTSRRVAHSAEQMFALVADVEKYPQFLPLCQALRVRRREERNGLPVVIADMTIAYKVFHETFTSRVTLDAPKRTIVVEYLEGPFRHLENRWVFRPTGESTCDIDFFIAWELRSRALAMVVGAVFDRVFRRYSEAFEKRADEVYGRTATVRA